MKKFLLIAGIVIAVVIIVAAILIYSYKDQIAEFAAESTVEMMKSVVLENLPETISEDSVKVIFDGALKKFNSGEINAIQLQELMNAFQTSQNDGKLDSLEVSSLLKSLKQLQQ